jgi:hypothetical protein
LNIPFAVVDCADCLCFVLQAHDEAFEVLFRGQFPDGLHMAVSEAEANRTSFEALAAVVTNCLAQGGLLPAFLFSLKVHDRAGPASTVVRFGAHLTSTVAGLEFARIPVNSEVVVWTHVLISLVCVELRVNGCGCAPGNRLKGQWMLHCNLTAFTMVGAFPVPVFLIEIV